MPASTLPARFVAILAFGAANLLNAQTTDLHSKPSAKDLGQPAGETGKAAPTPIPLLPELKLTAQFDTDGDHRLDTAERRAARAYLAQHPPPDSVPLSGRPNQPTPQAVALEPVKPGQKLTPDGIPVVADEPLYGSRKLRTIFLEFAEADWEKELTDFARTDVLVPARLTVDGKILAGVGVRFRNELERPVTANGYKHSLDLQLDHTLADQRLGGQRQLHLLAAGTDPTFLRTMLYLDVAREYIPTPRASFVRVVINGEDWGVYTSVEPLDENFVRENFSTTEGTRWTVLPGGTLAWLGDTPDAYRNSYRLESPEDPAAWAELIQLCKLLKQTPSDQLEAALTPRLDVDGALKFLALENALINQSGYGSATGSFGLYLATDGRFHLVPQDAESSFRLLEVSEYAEHPQGGGSGTGGRRGGGRESPGRDGTNGKGGTAGDAVPRGYNSKDFPRQSGTDLAMLLSYSFIAKADSDFDENVTKDEWLAFANSWFFVMDEDRTGSLTHEQFIAKMRLLITPPSIIDGRTTQTFGKDDAAAEIGQDFFNAMDENHDGRLTQEELVHAFERWFTAWCDGKSGKLTQAMLQRGFNELFTKSVFEADQSYIARHDSKVPANDESNERGGRGGRGGRRGGGGGGGGGGSGIGLGPLHIGMGGRGGHGGGSRGLVTFDEQLDPLAGQDDDTKPLLTKLLAVPAWRTRYLTDLSDITDKWLLWSKLGPIAKEYHDLIAEEVRQDTHKPASYEHFVQELDQDTTEGSRDGDEAPSLKAFVAERRSYLLKDDEIKSRVGY